MGLIFPEEAVNGLEGALNFFREKIKSIFDVGKVSIDSLYMFVIILGVYLYSKYYLCGEHTEKGYKIFADTVRELYESYDSDLADVVYKIITNRNLAVHNPYIPDTNDKIKGIVSDIRVVRLLRCEGIIDRNGNFIEPVGGVYKSALNRNEAMSNIKSMLDKINAEDAESIQDFMSAISKMQGDN